MDDRLRAYVALTLDVGLNLAAGQHVLVTSLVENAPFVRAVADEAYARGARYVEADYGDNHVRRALIAHGPEESLSYTPPWRVARLEALAEARGAFLQVAGDPEPELLSDLDHARVGQAQQRELLATWSRLLGERDIAWSIVAFPNAGWAETVFGEPDVERLWNAVAAAVRLDEPDPVAAWRTHVEKLHARTRALTARRFDELRFRGPGTDLRLGLHPDGRWLGGATETRWGRRHVPNLPTEEVFTTPDARRADGVVRSTRPLPFGGTTVRELALRFEGGRIVDVQAASGADVVRSEIEKNTDAERLGEVALVDGSSAVGRTGITFSNVLFDENAASHLAYGAGFPHAVEGAVSWSEDQQRARGINVSTTHRDFMIGGPEVDVFARTRDGDEVPVIVSDEWVLPDV